jgi:hypothetical protein
MAVRGGGRRIQMERGARTGSELGLVRDVVLVEILRLLLGLLVVNRVGTGWFCAKYQPGLS